MDRLVLVFAMLFGLNLVDLNAALPRRGEDSVFPGLWQGPEQCLDTEISGHCDRCLATMARVVTRDDCEVVRTYRTMLADESFSLITPEIESGSLSRPTWRQLLDETTRSLSPNEFRMTIGGSESSKHLGYEGWKSPEEYLRDMREIGEKFRTRVRNLFTFELRFARRDNGVGGFRDQRELHRLCTAMSNLGRVDLLQLGASCPATRSLMLATMATVRRLIAIYVCGFSGLMTREQSGYRDVTATQDERMALVEILESVYALQTNCLDRRQGTFYAPLVVLALMLMTNSIELAQSTNNPALIRPALQRIAPLLVRAVGVHPAVPKDRKICVLKLLRFLSENWSGFSEEILNYAVYKLDTLLACQDLDDGASDLDTFMELATQLNRAMRRADGACETQAQGFRTTIRDFFKTLSVPTDGPVAHRYFVYNYQDIIRDIEIATQPYMRTLQNPLDTSTFLATMQKLSVELDRLLRVAQLMKDGRKCQGSVLDNVISRSSPSTVGRTRPLFRRDPGMGGLMDFGA